MFKTSSTRLDAQDNSVNAHAEELRSHFVQHEGKKTVVVYAIGNRYTVDFGKLAHQLTVEMQKHVRKFDNYLHAYD